MAEQGSVYDLKELQQKLQCLFSRYTYNDLQADSKPFCSSFCKLVEYYASRWKVPLPQLRILERSLCCFTQASTFFTVGCDHVRRTLSSLALSIFELLLFFDKKDFTQDPLRKITVTFQECCSSLARFQNVHLLQVERLLRAGGPWASQTLHTILSESILPQTEVEGCISSEPPVFLELRVRYLLSCQRLPEAQALAKCCAQHPTVGQHLFFFQVYLTGLYKMAQHECLLEEVADFSGKDAVTFICSLDSEENDNVLLGLSRVFLFQQLHRGDMHFLCDLVCLWGRLHSRLKTSKEALLKECEQLILFATNVNAIFPFIRAIIQELSEDGVQFCMELCANALRSCPPCDAITKSLIYKTMANLVPNDLEICRACALLVFFLERSVEAYKMVYILYMHPDQEYYVDCCPIGNRVRFETLQTLKKDLYFDPEFWNLIALRTNCLKLINEKVLSAALEEIMEEKWVPSYCLKETKSSSSRSKFTKKNGLNKEKTLKGDRQNHDDSTDKAPARKVGRPRLNKHLPLKQKKGKQGSRQWQDMSSNPTRRSTFWQLDRIHCNRALDYRENRRTTRLSERIPAKRMIRTPKWLLEDSGTLEKNTPVIVKRQYPNFPYLPLRRRRVVVKNNAKDDIKSDEKLKDNQTNGVKQEQEVSLDSQTASTAPQVVLELSLPDNELLGTFTDEPCNRYRGLPQRLFYKPTLKVLPQTEPEKANLRNDVILTAQDTTSFILMLHCYSKRPKGKKIGTNSQGSSSTVMHSSDQVEASKKEQLNDKPAVEMKVTISSQTHQVTDKILRSSKEKLNEKGTLTRDTDIVIEPKVTRACSLATAIAESTVEMEVKVATQKNRHSPRLDKTQNTEYISSTVSKKETSEKDNDRADGKLCPISASEQSKLQEAAVINGEVLVNGTQCQEDSTSTDNGQAPFNKPTVEVLNAEKIDAQTRTDNINNMPSVATESKTEMPQSLDKQEDTATDNSAPVVPKLEKDDSKSLPTSSLSSNTALEDDGFDPTEPQPECEESKLEFCCFFCHKNVKGRHLVAHAMFHYRKDECMFCGVVFKNNLKAMMHLSNHLEKLKKLQNPTANSSLNQSREKANQTTTVEANTVLNEKKRRGRPKKPLPTIRKLSSGYKFRDRTKQEEGSAKDLRSQDHVHKVNGHIGKRKKRTVSDGFENNLITKTRLRHRSIESYRNNEIKPVKVEREKPLVISSEQKHEEKSKTSKQTDINKNTGPQEKLCCPVDGCTWFTLRKHAAFLYHVLENHYPDEKPLELVFHMANNSCSICKRVLYSFEHFLHHVGRHRSVPRHPCPHKGCTSRFKTTIEMRRHARKHSPLQAMCCLPGCPKLFICQWALILHEKDHFSKKSKATQSSDKAKSIQVVIKQEKQDVIKKCVKSREKVAPTSTGKSLKDTNNSHNSAIPKKDLSAQSAATRLLQRLRKRQITKNNLSQRITHKIVSSAGKPNYKLRHSLQRREKNGKQRLGSKVLPPREAKSSQNSSCVKNIMSGKESNQAKTSEVHKKLKEGKKNTDGSKIRWKVSNRPQRVTNAGGTRTIERNASSSTKDNSKMSNSKRTKHVQRNLKREAPVNDSPVNEENEIMDTTDTTDSMAVVRNKKGSEKDILEEKEQVKPPNNAGEVVSNFRTVDSKPVVQEVIVQNEQKAEDGTSVATAVSSNDNSFGETNEAAAVAKIDLPPVETPETGKRNMISKAEKCEQEQVVGLENLDEETSKMQRTESSDKALVNLPTFGNIDGVNEVTPELGAEENDGNMVSSNALNNAPVTTAEEPNVASTQTAEGENGINDHVFEPTDKTVVQNPEDKADVDTSVELADRPTSANIIRHGAFENTLQVTSKGHVAAEDISILEKLESTDLTANASTSQTEEVEPNKSENITTEETVMDITAKNKSALINTSSSLSETPEQAVAQKRFRPTFCNKNDILSALKTLVKSKNDKVKTKNEVKNSATKRKNELIKTSASKKFKSEIQTQEDVASSADTSSTREEKKETETTDSSAANSCASIPSVFNVSMTKGKVRKVRNKSKLTNERDAVKKQRTGQRKTQKKPSAASKNVVDKSTKKTKREKSKAKSVKPKSKDRKIVAKASTKLDTHTPEVPIARSNEVKSQSLSNEDDNQAHNKQHHNRKVDDVETKSEAPVQKRPHNETCLKKRDVYDLVPEEDENPLATFEKALNEYKKRPYMRLPATAYLEEKFTIMPKRRKDMSMFFGSSRKIQTTPEQRQRCANCFNTFSCEEELQWHLQQKCSSLFGFESDEEGTS